MWEKTKKVFNLFFRVCPAIIIIAYTFIVFLLFIDNKLITNTTLINQVSVMAIIFSLPGIIAQIATTLNPKKKIYKLSCRCPKCKFLIEMDMKEE
ncbi:hypothetical protein J2S08_001843 [Bacillus chungangensis]|uniref:Uncharacterized protein n=1 Tax=Bacillus chungangensis TaxID=587633 RepID=A0ABT9WS14_9BACI|nr:hypothetical protein [Bacillus chungangensis]